MMFIISFFIILSFLFSRQYGAESPPLGDDSGPETSDTDEDGNQLIQGSYDLHSPGSNDSDEVGADVPYRVEIADLKVKVKEFELAKAQNETEIAKLKIQVRIIPG